MGSKNPAPVAPVTATPSVTGSRVWSLIVGVTIAVIALLAISAISSRWYPEVHDLRYLDSGETLVLEIEPGHSARVEFTWQGVTPAMWSSSLIELEDSNKKRFTLKGNKDLQGAGRFVATESYTFRNRGGNAVTVKFQICGATPCSSLPTGEQKKIKRRSPDNSGDFVNNSFWILGFAITFIVLSLTIHVVIESKNEVLPKAALRVSSKTVLVAWLATIFFASRFLTLLFRVSSKAVLVIAWLATIFFATRFLTLLSGGEALGIWPALACGLCLAFINAGGKTVGFGTVTGVFSRFTGKRIGTMRTGSMHWLVPGLEFASETPDAGENTAVDTQKLVVEIPEFPWYQTGTAGIQATVRRVTFTLKLKEGQDALLQEVEGGVETINRRIRLFISEFFLEKIGGLLPVDIDTAKVSTLRRLAGELETEVDDFCLKNHYPYEVVDSVTIGDTELEAWYYQALAKKQLAVLNGEAADLEAEMLRDRLLNMGRGLIQNGSPEEQLQLEAAQVALGLVKKIIGGGVIGRYDV